MWFLEKIVKKKFSLLVNFFTKFIEKTYNINFFNNVPKRIKEELKKKYLTIIREDSQTHR